MKTKRFIMALTLIACAALAAFGQSTTGGNQRSIPAYQLTIASNVRGASIYIDGELQRERTPATFTLRRGSYDIRVEARGYRPWFTTVTLTGSTTLRADLAPPYATIVQRVPDEYLNYSTRNPAGQISMFVDGQLRNEARIQVQEGWHEIAIVSGGLRIENDFYLEAGTTYDIELILRMNLLRDVRGGY